MQIYLYIDNKKHLLSGIIRLAKSKKYLKKGANLMINHTDENNTPEIQCKFGDAIRDVLDETNRGFLDDLLPWSPNLPANCRKPDKDEIK